MPTYDDDFDPIFDPIGSDQLNSLMPRRSQQDYLQERAMRDLALKQGLSLSDWELVTGVAPDGDEHALFCISEAGVSYQSMGASARLVADSEVVEFHDRRASEWKLSFPCTSTALLAFIDATDGSFAVHMAFRSAVNHLRTRPVHEAPNTAKRTDALAREIAYARERLSKKSNDPRSASLIWNELGSQAGKGCITQVTATFIIWRRDDGEHEKIEFPAFRKRITRSNRENLTRA